MGNCYDYYKGDTEKVTRPPISGGTGCFEPVSDYEVLMDTYQIMKKLQEHRKLLSAAIASLERLAAGKGGGARQSHNVVAKT